MRMRRTLQTYAIIGLLLMVLIPSMAPPIAGDGIPIITRDAHAELRENSQLAYITVLNDTTEQLELFINVVSLTPGEEMTVVIPLRTAPLSMNVNESTDNEFRDERNMKEIKELGRKQSNNINHVTDYLDSEEGEDVMGFVLFGGPFLVLYSWSLSFTGGGWWNDYSTPGFSVDLMNFSSEESLGDFYDSLNMTLPEDVEETIDRYAEYNIAVVNFTSRPPIDAIAFENLTRYVPGSVDRFREFVRNNTKIEVWPGVYQDEFYYSVQNVELRLIYQDFLQRVGEIGEEMNLSWSDQMNLTRSFNHLMSVTYGYGEMEGYVISMELPLYEGNAFFPLGTTPVWGGTDDIEIIFQCNDDHSIDLNVDADYEAFDDGNHYYIYSRRGEAPDYDLEGRYHDDDTKWEQRKAWFNTRVYENRVVLSFVTSYLVMFAVLLVLTRIWYWKNWKKLGWRNVSLITGGVMIGSLVLGVVISLMVTFAIMVRWKVRRELQFNYLGPIAWEGTGECSGNDIRKIPGRAMGLYPLVAMGSWVGGIYSFIFFLWFISTLSQGIGYLLIIGGLFMISSIGTALAINKWWSLKDIGMTYEQTLLLEHLSPESQVSNEMVDLGFLGTFVFLIFITMYMVIVILENLGGSGNNGILVVVISTILLLLLFGGLVKLYMMKDERIKKRMHDFIEAFRYRKNVWDYVYWVKCLSRPRYPAFVRLMSTTNNPLYYYAYQHSIAPEQQGSSESSPPSSEVTIPHINSEK